MTVITDFKNLYNTDYNLWLETTVQLLREKQVETIDYENLIAEIESMGKSEKNALKSNLRILLMHHLKWRYQPSRRCNSWQYLISEHCLRILDSLEDSPSFEQYLTDILPKIYQNARLLAARETGLNQDLFPIECPFNLTDILNPEYLSE